MQQQQQEGSAGSSSKEITQGSLIAAAAGGAAQGLNTPEVVGAMATVETVENVKTLESPPLGDDKMVLSQRDTGSCSTTEDSVTQHSTVPHSSTGVSDAELKSPPISKHQEKAATNSHVVTSISREHGGGVINYQQPEILHGESSTSVSHTLTQDSPTETQASVKNITTSQSIGNSGLLLTPTTSYVTVDNNSEPIPVIDLSKVPAGSEGYVEDITRIASSGLVDHSGIPEHGLAAGAQDSTGLAEGEGGGVASGGEHYAPAAGVASAAAAPPSGQQRAPAGERFLMQGTAGIVLDLSLLDEEDRRAMEMSPVTGSAADAGGSAGPAGGDTSGKKGKPGLLKPHGHNMAGGSPDTGAQVRNNFLNTVEPWLRGILLMR